MHALTACGEAAFAIALADSLFLSISPDAARSKVLLFLGVSLAPFAVIAPFIGPVIDRVPGGRRITVLIVNVLRCVTVVLMIQRINSVALFPLAFISLVLSRTYAVSKTALVPTLVGGDQELVAANGNLGLLAGLIGFAAAVPAGLLQLVDSRLTLSMSALMFGLAGLVSLQLPRHVATTPDTANAAEIVELKGSGVRHATKTQHEKTKSQLFRAEASLPMLRARFASGASRWMIDSNARRPIEPMPLQTAIKTIPAVIPPSTPERTPVALITASDRVIIVRSEPQRRNNGETAFANIVASEDRPSASANQAVPACSSRNQNAT